MNLKKCVLLFTIIALLSLSSCQDAPDEVKEENDTLNSTVQARSVEPVYQTMDEIRTIGEEALTTNTTNVKVDKLIIGSGDSMPAYKVSPYNSDFELLKPLVKYLYNEDFSTDSPYCKYYVGGEKYDENDPKSDINPHDFIMYLGKAMDFDRSLVYHETGYSFYTGISGDDPYSDVEYFPTEKRYKLNLGEKLENQSYTMTDGNEWSVTDAAEFARNFVDTYFSPLENNMFTYSMTDFRVKKLDDSYGYVVEFQRIDKSGNLYDNHYYYANDEDYSSDNNWISEKCPFLYSSEIQISFTEKEKVQSFIKCNTPYAGAVIDSGEKLLSLSSAIDIISMNMAGASTYTFETAELEYYYVGLDCPDFTNPSGGKQATVNQEDMLNDADVELRPYWAFTAQGCYPDTESLDGNLVNQNSLFLVDALTGDFYVY